MPTVIAFDYGTRRIGVAIGETEVGIPHPLSVIEAESNDARYAAIGAVLATWHPERCVVGLPFKTDGTEHDMTRRARRFAQRLRGRFGIKVDLVDERYTSTDAAIDLGAAGASTAATERSLDAVAACAILSAWFDQLEKEA